METNLTIAIPKIMHRIWITFNPNKPAMPAIYQEFDLILKALHPHWQFMEWDDKKVLNFVMEFYPAFLPTYLAYDVPVKRHDASRYLIVNHFGGVFIQHSIKLQKNIEPLLEGADLVFSAQSKNLDIGDSFFASIPKHNFWQGFINKLPNTAKLYVLDTTGPRALESSIKKYSQENKDYIKILPYTYLYPFDWTEKNSDLINDSCYQHNKCFELFPDAYGFCLWTGSWLNTLEVDAKAKLKLQMNEMLHSLEQDNQQQLLGEQAEMIEPHKCLAENIL